MPTVLITGAGSGIGLASARLLAQRGYRLILIIRPGSALPEGPWPEHTRFEPCDLSRIESVRTLIDKLVEERQTIDVLVCNAAVQPWTRIETEDGLELGFATTVLATFALIEGLAPLLARSAHRLVVVTGSLVHKWGKYDLSDLQRERHFDPNASYNGAKLCQMQLVTYFARKLQPLGIAVHSLEPGMTRTAFARNFRGFYRLMSLLWRPFMRAPEDVARNLLDLLDRRDLMVTTGSNWLRARPKPLSPAATDRQAAETLASACFELLGTASAPP